MVSDDRNRLSKLTHSLPGFDGCPKMFVGALVPPPAAPPDWFPKIPPPAGAFPLVVLLFCGGWKKELMVLLCYRRVLRQVKTRKKHRVVCHKHVWVSILQTTVFNSLFVTVVTYF